MAVPHTRFTEHEQRVIAGVLALEPVEDIAAAIGRDATVVVQHLDNIGKKFDLFARMLRADDAGRS